MRRVKPARKRGDQGQPPLEELLQAELPPDPEPTDEAQPAAADAAGAVEVQAPLPEPEVPLPVPPPMPEADVVPARQLRARAERRLEVLGGVLTFYNRGLFTATCSNPAHGKCVLSRTSEPGGRAAQGRPLGLMSAWLFIGQDLPSKRSHWDQEAWPNYETRAYHREQLEAIEGGLEMLACERPQEAGEGAELLGRP